jgi:hypothetical protein
MVITKEVFGKELYVYFNGQLAFKKWIGQSCIVFNEFGGNNRPNDSLCSITEENGVIKYNIKNK